VLVGWLSKLRKGFAWVKGKGERGKSKLKLESQYSSLSSKVLHLPTPLTLQKFSLSSPSNRPSLLLLTSAIATCLLIVLLQFQGVDANESDRTLPSLQVHPLPPSLAQWKNSPNVGDYFARIQSTEAGSLIWSEFPIKVYLDRPENPQETSASDRRFLQWVKAVEEAIQEWTVYLPMVEILQPEVADIVIKREKPPLGVQIDPETGKLERFRARTAQTRYEFYIREGNSPILLHRMTVAIDPGLSEQSIRSATRHELGHALGIWGHSQAQTDAMYFSQVRTSPAISPRDINTLKKVYQQPTRLGWELPK
jgi:predicted Zn-dependent protease